MIISPLKGSRDVTLLRTIQSDEIVRRWHEMFQMDIVEEFKGYSEIFLYQCNQTKLRFFSPLELAGSEKLYHQLEKFDWYYMPNKWEHDAAIHDLKGCHNVLEIGCGRGDFVKRLRTELQIEAQGIELNMRAVDWANRNGIPVIQKDIYELKDERADFFDAVCAFQVLEHVADPRKFLTILLNLIKLNGKLILSVPNPDSFLKYGEYNLLDMPPHHVTRWNQNVFFKLETLFPLEVRNIRFEPLADYHVDWFLEIEGERLPTRLFRLPFSHFLQEIIKAILKKSSLLRSRIQGHTLYVCLEKVG